MASQRLQVKHFVLGATAVLIAAIIGTSIVSAMLLREREIDTWRRQLADLSLVLAEQTTQAMSSAQLVLDSIAERVEDMHVSNDTDLRLRAGSEALHEVLRDKITGLPQVDVASIVAANGDVINFSRAFPVPPINLAERDYFQARRSNPGLGVFVGVPVPNKANGKWVFYLSRRLNDAGGRFLGLVLVGISVDQFTDFYQRLAANFGEGAAITLYRRDFTVLTRWPQAEEAIGKQNLTGSSHLVVEEMKKTDDVIYTAAPRFSEAGLSVARLGAVRVLQRFPMIVNLTVTENFFLANWRHTVQWIAAIALGSTTALIIIAFLLLRVASQRERSARLLDSLADQLPGLLFQYQMTPDGHSFFPYVNKAFRDVYRLKPRQTPIDESAIFAYQHPDDAARIRASILESARTLNAWHEEYRLLLPGKGLT